MDRDEAIRELQARYRELGPVLNERQRRQWAAAEAIKLGRGGISRVSQALRMSPNTIKRGMQELSGDSAVAPLEASARIRKPGGGRKPQDRRDGASVDGASSDGTSCEAPC